MSRIYVQRGSAEGYKQNISSTLSKPLSRESIGRAAAIVGPDRSLAQRVEALINQGPQFVWGTKTRGRSDIARMRPGDLAIFVLGGTPAYYGIVSEVLADDVPVDIRRALSREFWGSEAWEYVWCNYEDDVNVGRMVQIPVAAYVEQVSREGDFNLLLSGA